MASLLQHLFPFICGAAYIAVWQLFIWNGSLEYLEAASKAGAFPDGTAIKNTYIGIKVIDDFLTTLVVFNLPVTLTSFSEGKLFLLQFLGNVLALPMIIIVEESRNVNRRKALLYSTLWLSLSQLIGSAIMLPLYCYVRLLQQSKLTHTSSRYAAVPPIVVVTLIPSLLLGFVLPMFLMLCPTAEASSRHQQHIAIFQLFPLSIALTQQSLNLALGALDLGLWDYNRTTGNGQTVTRFLYGSVAAFSGGIHLYCVVSLIRDPSLSWIQFFIPQSQVQGFGNQVLVFLKFDYLFTFLALSLWIYLEFQRLEHLNKSTAAAGLLAGSVSVGPGATAAIAWAIREHRLTKMRADKGK